MPDKDIKQQIGDLIRKSRKAKGLTQKKAAELIDVAESTYSLYESGRQNLTVETLQKVAKAFGLEFIALFK